MDWKKLFTGTSSDERTRARVALQEVDPEPVDEDVDLEDEEDEEFDENEFDEQDEQEEDEEELEAAALNARLTALESQLQLLSAENESLREAQAFTEGIEEATELEDNAEAFAQRMVKAGKFLPSKHQMYSDFHFALANLCRNAEALGAEGLDAVTLACDGEDVSLLEAFENIVESSKSDGWTQEFAKTNLKVKANRSTTPQKDNSSANGTQPVSDDVIEDMVAVATGKPKQSE